MSAPNGTQRFTIQICDQCLRLEGAECHNPLCVFCRCEMAEVKHYLDVLLIRPIIEKRVQVKVKYERT